jgi:hypothetical protein
VLYIFIQTHRDKVSKSDQRRLIPRAQEGYSKGHGAHKDQSPPAVHASHRQAPALKTYRGPRITPEYIKQKKRLIEQLLIAWKEEKDFAKKNRAWRIFDGLQENVYSYYVAIGDKERAQSWEKHLKKWADRLREIIHGNIYDGDPMDLIKKIWQDKGSKYWAGKASEPLSMLWGDVRYPGDQEDRIRRIIEALKSIAISHPSLEVRHEADKMLRYYESSLIEEDPSRRTQIKQQQAARKLALRRLFKKAVEADLLSQDREKIEDALLCLDRYPDPELTRLCSKLARTTTDGLIRDRLISYLREHDIQEWREIIRGELLSGDFERILDGLSQLEVKYDPWLIEIVKGLAKQRVQTEHVDYLQNYLKDFLEKKKAEMVGKETSDQIDWQRLIDTMLHNPDENERGSAASDLCLALRCSTFENITVDQRRRIINALSQASTDPSKAVRSIAQETFQFIQKKMQEEKDSKRIEQQYEQKRIVLGPFGLNRLELYIKNFHNRMRQKMEEYKERARDRDQRFTEQEIYKRFEGDIRYLYVQTNKDRLEDYKDLYGEDAFYKEQLSRFNKLVSELEKLLEENRPQ